MATKNILTDTEAEILSSLLEKVLGWKIDLHPIGQVPPPTGGGRGGGETGRRKRAAPAQQGSDRLPGEAASGVPAPE